MTTKITRVASKYAMGPKVGAGSFGEVYVVTQLGYPEIYALKRVTDL